MTKLLLAITVVFAPIAAWGACRMTVEKAVLHYYDDKPSTIQLAADFHFAAKGSNFLSECQVMSETDIQRHERYPLIRVEGPVRVIEKRWPIPRAQRFDFTPVPQPVLGPQFVFMNVLELPADAQPRRGQVEMTLKYQWVDDKGVSLPEELKMLVSYDLDSPKSKRYGPHRFTAKEIVLMPFTVAVGVVKLLTCGLEC